MDPLSMLSLLSFVFNVGGSLVGGEADRLDTLAGYELDLSLAIEDVDINVELLTEKIMGAQEAARLEGGQARERYERLIRTLEGERERLLGLAGTDQERELRQAIEGYEHNRMWGAAGWETERIDRKRRNEAYIDTELAGVAESGKMTAGLAGSGVRATGSASALQSEMSRFYDVNLTRLDRGIEESAARFGAGRAGLKLGYDQSVEDIEGAFAKEVSGIEGWYQREMGAGEMAYEHTIESLLGRDVAFEDILGGDIDWTDITIDDEWEIMRGALGEYIPGHGWTNTEIDWLKEQIGILEQPWDTPGTIHYDYDAAGKYGSRSRHSHKHPLL